VSYLSDISLRRGIGLLVLVLAMLLGGTWATVEVTINHLLNQNAKDTARNWASFLAANVTDLDKIAAGEQPSAASLAFFQATRKAGEVFRYVIFNREGYSQLVSDRDGTVLVSLSEFSAEAVRAAVCKIACNSDPLRGDFRVQFRPLLTFCVSVLPFGPDGPGRTLGDDWRGQDRPDTTRLF